MERPERNDRSERPERNEQRSERLARSDRSERPERNDRDRNRQRTEPIADDHNPEPQGEATPVTQSGNRPENQDRNRSSRSRPPRLDDREPTENTEEEQVEPSENVPQMRPSSAPRNSRYRSKEAAPEASPQPANETPGLVAPVMDSEPDHVKEARLSYEQALKEAMNLQSDVDDMHGPASETQVDKLDAKKGRQPRAPRPPRPPRAERPSISKEAPAFPLEPQGMPTEDFKRVDDWVIDEAASSIEGLAVENQPAGQTFIPQHDAHEDSAPAAAAIQQSAPAQPQREALAPAAPIIEPLPGGANADEIAALRENYRAQAKARNKWVNVTSGQSKSEPANRNAPKQNAPASETNNWVEQSRQDFENQVSTTDFDQIAEEAKKSLNSEPNEQAPDQPNNR